MAYYIFQYYFAHAQAGADAGPGPGHDLDLQQSERDVAGHRSGSACGQDAYSGNLCLQGGHHVLPLRIRCGLQRVYFPGPGFHHTNRNPSVNCSRVNRHPANRIHCFD